MDLSKETLSNNRQEYDRLIEEIKRTSPDILRDFIKEFCHREVNIIGWDGFTTGMFTIAHKTDKRIYIHINPDWREGLTDVKISIYPKLNEMSLISVDKDMLDMIHIYTSLITKPGLFDLISGIVKRVRTAMKKYNV